MVRRLKTGVCVDTIVDVGTVGLDSGIVGRANGNSVEM